MAACFLSRFVDGLRWAHLDIAGVAWRSGPKKAPPAGRCRCSSIFCSISRTVTQVDFYIIESDSDDARLKMACRIADKAMQQSQHVFINTPSDVEARKLDELLWTFFQGSFVPHRIVQHELPAPPQEPVIIGLRRAPVGERWDVLINLAADVPDSSAAAARRRARRRQTQPAASKAASVIASTATGATSSIP